MFNYSILIKNLNKEIKVKKRASTASPLIKKDKSFFKKKTPNKYIYNANKLAYELNTLLKWS